MSEYQEESPLEEFKEKIGEVLELLNRDNIPIIVAGDGTVEGLLQGDESGLNALNALQHGDTVEAVRHGLVEADAGDTAPLDQALKAILGKSSE